MKWNVSLGNEKNMMDQVKKCAIYGKDHKGTYLERSDKKQQLLMLVLFDHLKFSIALDHSVSRACPSHRLPS